MACRLLLVVSMLIIFPATIFGGVLKGTIKDPKGELLPFATVFVEGTTIGTNANGSGYYELSLAPGLYKVVCQYIGFKKSSFNVTISGDESISHNFVLANQSMEMKEVVIRATDEDPAYRIIRNAIRRRSFHLDQIRQFQTGIYLKGVIRTREIPKKILGKKVDVKEMGADSTGKGVLYLVEEHASYYRSGDKERTVIHSVKESGSPDGVGMAKFPDVISFYENNVNILGGKSRGFISPISNNALLYYKYKLEGQFADNGKNIYKIKVKQRRSFEPCFDGWIYISDSDWAIHSLDLTLAKKAGMDMFDTLRLNQLYLPVAEDLWLIKSQIMYFTINFFGFDATANFVTVYDNQHANEPLADTLFNQRITSSYDADANKKDSTYWVQNRPIPLEADEEKDYVKKDSLRKLYEDPKRRDSLRKKMNHFRPLGLITDGYSHRGKKTTWFVNPILVGGSNILNFNIVEGFNVAPVVNIRHLTDTGKWVGMDVATRYGFSNTHFNAIGRVYRLVRDRTWLTRIWQAGLEGGKYVFQYNGDNPVYPWFNTYSSLIYREADLRIYERSEVAGYISRKYGNGFGWMARASWQERNPLHNTTDFAFTKGDISGYKSNTPSSLIAASSLPWMLHQAAILSVNVSWQPGFKYIQYPTYKVPERSKWPMFSLSYQKGIDGILGSDVDFDKWKASVNGSADLKLQGALYFNFAAGGFLNSKKVAIPDLNHLLGNRGLGFATPYLQSFQFARYYEFSNRQNTYTEAHVEYHLNGLLTNKIPLFRQLNWYLVVGANSYYSSDLLYYHEAFVGLDNLGFKLARLFRLDFVQSWDSNGGRNSGLRLGLNTFSFSNLKNTDTGSEW